MYTNQGKINIHEDKLLRYALLIVLVCLGLCGKVSFVLGYEVESLPNTQVIGDIVIGPVKHEVVITPGAVETIEVTVLNRTGNPREFSLTFGDFEASQDTDQVLVFREKQSGELSLAEFLFVEQRSFVLAHGERAKIPVTIYVPTYINAGGMYATVNISSLPLEGSEQSERSSGAAVIPQVSVLLFVTTGNDVVAKGRLLDFKADLGSFSQVRFNPPQFRIVFENTGEKHINPYGILTITDHQGTVINSSVIDPWFVLPRSIRSRDVSLDTKLKAGRYLATLELNRGYDDVIDRQTVVFIVVPVHLLWILVVGLVVAAVAGLIYKKRNQRVLLS